jgi:hypothetical protein
MQQDYIRAEGPTDGPWRRQLRVDNKIHGCLQVKAFTATRVELTFAVANCRRSAAGVEPQNCDLRQGRQTPRCLPEQVRIHHPTVGW